MELEREKKYWKNIAIGLMIFILVSGTIVTLAYLKGVDMIKKENVCGTDVCINDDYYSYNDITEMCYCYVDDEIVNSVNMDLYMQTK